MSTPGRDPAMPSYRRPWEQRMVSHLAASKAAGYSFGHAWQAAMKSHPPCGRDRLGARDYEQTATLFDEEGKAEESVVEAMERFCRTAWYGECPGLASFSLDLFRLAEDDSSSVSHQSNFRLAA